MNFPPVLRLTLLTSLVVIGCGVAESKPRFTDRPVAPPSDKPERPPEPKIEVKKCRVDASAAGPSDGDGFRKINIVATADVASDIDLTQRSVVIKLRGGPKNQTYSDKLTKAVRLPDGKLQFSATLRCPANSNDTYLSIFVNGKTFFEERLDLED